jgi:hypothetical protein
MVVTKKSTNLVLLQRNQYFLPKTNNTCVGTHELHLCLPHSPLSTYPPGREGSRGRIPNILPLEVGGEWFGNTPKSTLFFSASPRERSCLPSCQSISGFPPEKDCIDNTPRALCNQYPASPQKKIALATGHGNEGAIRANAGNKRGYNLHDCFGRSPVFEGKKTGEKGGLQVAWGALVVEMRNVDHYQCT